MEAYSSFAEVYDLFMDNVPYREWCGYITALLAEHGIADGLILDLGCGTGRLTRLLAEAGYDMIGVDYSGEMLDIARRQGGMNAAEKQDAGETVRVQRKDAGEAVRGQKQDAGNSVQSRERDAGEAVRGQKQDAGNSVQSRASDILYLQQDMRSFELYGTVRAVVSSCDALNYILEEDDLRKIFRLVNNYLDPGGLFLFDMNTVYKYRDMLGETTICENREEGSFIWENYYDGESGINEYDLTLFIREEGGLYRKYEETHYQRGYELSDIKRLLEEAGLTFAAAYDAFTREPVRADSERICVLASERGK